MITGWVITGLAIAVAVVAALAARRRVENPTDLGTVSHQWIAEHRLGSGQDSHR